MKVNNILLKLILFLPLVIYFIFLFSIYTKFSNGNLSYQSSANSNENKFSADSINIRMGDRFFIQAVLNGIFGPGALEITYKRIFLQASVFGGPCDFNEQVRVSNSEEGIDDPNSLCPGGIMASRLPLVPNHNPLRYAYIRLACAELTSSPKNIQYAMSRVNQANNKFLTGPEEVSYAYQLFHPMIELPDKNMILNLEKIVKSPSTGKLDWPKLFYILCTDPSWQLI